MSIKRINEFPEGSGSLSNDDIFLVMDNPSGGGVTKKISLADLSVAIGGGGNANTGDITFNGTTISTANSDQSMTITTNGNGDIYIGADKNMIFDMNAWSAKGILLQDSQEDGYDDPNTPSLLKVGSIYHDTGTMVIKSDGTIVDSSGNSQQAYGGLWLTNGDNAGFKVPSPSGSQFTTNTVSIHNNNNTWNFTNDGNLNLPEGKTLNFGQNNDTLAPPAEGGSTDRVRLWDFKGGGTNYNYAIGAEPNHVWFAMDVNNGQGGFKFYSRNNEIFKISDDSKLMFPNGTTVASGTYDNGTGGNNGISLNCAVGYELNWQAGHLKATSDSGVTAATILCDSPIAFPGEGVANVQIDAAGLTFADGSTLATANDPRWNLFLPVAPTSVTGTAAEQAVDLTWTAPAVDPAPALPVTDYAIQYSDDNGATWTPYVDVVSTATSVSVTGLTNGTAYKFRVRAINAIGLGSYSAASGSYTPAIPVPTGVTGTGQDGAVALTWTAPSPLPIDGISDYVVQFSSDGGSTWATFADGVSTATSATVTGLTNGTAYTFRVAVVTGANVMSGYSTASAAVTPGVPSIVPSLLMHFDGAEGSTTFTDSGPNHLAFTPTGPAAISTSQNKFGGASLACNSGVIESASLSDVAELGSDWTIEAWVYRPSGIGIATILNLHSSQYLPYGHHFWVGGDNMLRWDEGSQACATGGSVPHDQWCHVAACRTGGTTTIFIDGVAAATTVIAPRSGPYRVLIGGVRGGDGSNGFTSNMFIDELRVVAGTAVYTANFTPPTAPF